MTQAVHKSRFAAPRRTVLEAEATGAPGLCLLGYHRNSAATTGISPHAHEGRFELVYVVSGEIYFEADGSRHTLHGGDMFLTQPGQRHSTGLSPTSVCEFYWMQLDAACESLLCLQPAAAAALCQGLAAVHQCALHGASRWEKQLGALLRRLCGEQASGVEKAPMPPAVCAAATLLPLLCDAVSRASTPRAYSADIEAVLGYIAQNIEQPLALETLARQALLSVPRLKAKFSQQVGMPPRAYVNTAKMEAAKTLLRAGASVTDTAFRLSFCSSGYFSMLFRKVTGQTPSQFAAGARQARAGVPHTQQEAV